MPTSHTARSIVSGACKSYDLWKPEYFDSWGVQSWIYRIDEQVGQEAVLFTGAIFVVIAGEITISVADIDLIFLGVNVLVSSVETAHEVLRKRPTE